MRNQIFKSIAWFIRPYLCCRQHGIFDSISLHNPERNDAFMYFGMRFFLGYMMGCNPGQIDAMCMKFINKKKNDQILLMEEQIEDKKINI